MRSVLIVDDVDANRKLIKTVLSRKLSDTVYYEAENGFQALKIVNETEISVMILDIMMPEMDGTQVLKEIKASEKLKNISVVMCSAVNEIEYIEKALELGALDYFTKPLTKEQIRITLPLKVKNALDYYEQNTQLFNYNEQIREDIQLAEELQRAIISEHELFPEAEMWGRYLPCQKIGGDLFACKYAYERVWFIIADVSGHGIAAAMISTMMKVIFNVSISADSTPGTILKRINTTLMEVFNGSKYGLASAFVGCIAQDRLLYSNGGHPYPVFYNHATGCVAAVKQNGYLLGLLENAEFETLEIEIKPHDMILLFTDGIFDLGEDYGCANWGKMIEYVRLHIDELSGDMKLFLNGIMDYAKGHDSFVDDVAIMGIRKL